MMAKSDNARIAHSILFNVCFSFFQMGVQLVIVSALARKLTPADYGVFAFANSILVYVMHLTQRGLVSNIVSKPNLTPKDIGSAYVVSLFMCAATIAMVTCISLSVFLFTELKEQSNILLFMALPLTLQILSTPSFAILQRKLRFSTLNAIQLCSIIVGNGIVTIVCAHMGLGPWALAIGALAAALVNLVGTIMFGRAQFCFRLTAQEIEISLRRSVSFNIIRSLDVAWLQIPVILLGSLSSPSASGIYQRMQYLADLGMQLTIGKISGVLYPALASKGDGSSVDLSRMRTVLTMLNCGVIPIIAFTITSSREIVLFILGPQWLAGIPQLNVLIIAFGFWTANQAAGMTLEHAGRIRERTYAAVFTLGILLLLLIAFASLKPDYVVYAALISSMVNFVLGLKLAGESRDTFKEVIKTITPGGLLGVAVAAGSYIATTVGNSTWIPSINSLFLFVKLGISAIFVAIMLPVALRQSAMKPLTHILRQVSPTIYKILVGTRV